MESRLGSLAKIGALLLALACSSATAAQESAFRINYAEPVTVAFSVPDPAAGKPANSRTASVYAYGRQFDLDLDVNSRLLARLDQAQQTRLKNYEFMQGTVRGLPHSWVRLAIISGEVLGVIWDGSDLYALEPARMVLPHAVQPLNVPGRATVVYRFSEVQFEGSGAFCGASTASADRASESKVSALGAYLRLVEELRASADDFIGQLDIALVGDAEFRNLEPIDPAAAILARMNIVDGIFSSQVGIILLFPEIEVFSVAETDPFTSSDARELLGDLSDYRVSRPSVRDRGLAHLFTGRDLDGLTAGVAFIDALCEPTFGVGLTEGRHSTAISALIAAHEIGHNFGAPHDAEDGSPCAGTPPFFLMAAQINGSSEFSQCSLDQMAPPIAAAACIAPPQVADASVSATTPIGAFIGIPVDYPIDVAATGDLAVDDVVLATRLSGNFILDDFTTERGTCSFAAGTLTCALGSLPPGSSTRIVLRLTPTTLSPVTGTATLTAANDRIPENNIQNLRVEVAPAADVAISGLSPASITGVTRTPLEFTATVVANGVNASQGVRVTVSPAPHVFIGIAASQGSCVLETTVARCELGDLPAGATRTIQVRLEGRQAGATQVGIGVQSINDGSFANNNRNLSLNLQAAADANLRFPGAGTVVLNEPFDVGLLVQSAPGQALQGATVAVHPSFGVEILAVDVPGGSCTLQPVACDLGTLDPASSLIVNLRARATAAGSTVMHATFSAANDDDVHNNAHQMLLFVRYSVDIALQGVTAPGVFENRLARITTSIASRGAHAATNIAFSAQLHPTMQITAATIEGGTCTTSASLVNCALASLAADAQARVDIDVVPADVGQFPASFGASATGDGDPGNNNSAFNVAVNPFFDASLESTAASVITSTNELFELHLDITNHGRAYGASNLTLTGVPSAFTFDSFVNPTGSCSRDSANSIVICSLSSIPARGTSRVTLRLRSASVQQRILRAFINVSPDAFPQNNGRDITVEILPPPDAAVQVPGDVPATVNQAFDYEVLALVLGARAVDNVVVTLTPTAGLTIANASSPAGTCTLSTAATICNLGTLPGFAQNVIVLRLRATSAGGQGLIARLQATNDSDPSNNERSVSIIAANPPAPPSPPASSGGGGGGSLGAWLVVFLAALLLAGPWQRRTRRRLA